MTKLIGKAAAAATLVAMIAGASPALADDWSNDIIISSSSSVVISNDVTVSASTGGNVAVGGAGGAGGAAGNATNSGVEEGNSAQGGNGGDGGAGGVAIVTTGDAEADSSISNEVNSSDIEVVSDCGCGDESDDMSDNDIRIETSSDVVVANAVRTSARTGHNVAMGGEGGEGGYGGDGTNEGAEDDNFAGGGNAGAGGEGAGVDLWSGASRVYSETVNIVNTIVTRVQR